jgi:hypothetical protein
VFFWNRSVLWKRSLIRRLAGSVTCGRSSFVRGVNLSFIFDWFTGRRGSGIEWLNISVRWDRFGARNGLSRGWEPVVARNRLIWVGILVGRIRIRPGITDRIRCGVGGRLLIVIRQSGVVGAGIRWRIWF